MKKAALSGLLALSIAMLVSGTASAHVRFQSGIHISGGPLWIPPPVYYPAPLRLPPPVVYVERAMPPVYIEQNPVPAPDNYWYYCPDSKTYYPYVQSCPSDWMKVVPNNYPGARSPSPR